MTGLAAGLTGVMTFAFNAGTGNLLYPTMQEVRLPTNMYFDQYTVTTQGITGVVDFDLYRTTYATYATLTNLSVTGIGIYGIGGTKAQSNTTTAAWAGTTGLYGDIIQCKISGATGISGATLALDYHAY